MPASSAWPRLEGIDFASALDKRGVVLEHGPGSVEREASDVDLIGVRSNELDVEKS